MAVIALTASQILWLLMGAMPREDDKARRFAIVDKDGKTRIEMLTDEAGNPAISLLDETGADRISLWLDDLGSHVNLSGTGKNFASIQVLPEDSAAFILDGGGPDIQMTACVNGQSERERWSDIIVSDDASQSEARIATQWGGSLLTLSKGGGGPVALFIDKDGTSGLAISDEKETERIRLHLDPAGKSVFEVLDKDGKPAPPQTENRSKDDGAEK